MIQLAPAVYAPLQREFSTSETIPSREVLYFADFVKDIEVGRALSPFAETHEILPVTFSYTFGNEQITKRGYRVANDEEIRYFDRNTMKVYAITGPQGDYVKMDYSYNPNVPMPFLNAEHSCRLPQRRELQKAA